MPESYRPTQSHWSTSNFILFILLLFRYCNDMTKTDWICMYLPPQHLGATTLGVYQWPGFTDIYVTNVNKTDRIRAESLSQCLGPTMLRFWERPNFTDSSPQRQGHTTFGFHQRSDFTDRINFILYNLFFLYVILTNLFYGLIIVPSRT